MSPAIDPSAWTDLTLIEQVAEGNRNEVWRGQLGNEQVAVRRSRRSPASLAWELDLLEGLAVLNFAVPTVRPAANGERSVDGVVVQRWIDGHEPASEEEWHQVAAELQRLHQVLGEYPQRPQCCTVTELAGRRRSVDADLDAMPAEVQTQVVSVFDSFVGERTSLIHGDPDPSNIRIMEDGRVALLDWDESRVDICWHDLSNLGVVVLSAHDQAKAERLSHAWEAACGWVVEPDYAKRRLAKLDQ